MEAWHIPFFFQYLSHRAPLDEIHDQVILVILDEEITDTRNAGVIEIQQESPFTLEPFYCLVTLSLVLKFTQQLFDCTGAVETRIDCTIDGA